MKTKMLKILVLPLLLFILQSCSFTPISINEKPDASGESATASFQIIKTSSPSITILWDAPGNDAPDSYKFYYREYQNTTWYEISEIDGSLPLELSVNYSGLSASSQDIVFGVSAVYLEGESFIHSSLDSTAQPNTGWYVHWEL